MTRKSEEIKYGLKEKLSKKEQQERKKKACSEMKHDLEAEKTSLKELEREGKCDPIMSNPSEYQQCQATERQISILQGRLKDTECEK